MKSQHWEHSGEEAELCHSALRSNNLYSTGGNKELALPRHGVTHPFKSLQSSPNAAGKVKLPCEEESGHVRSAEHSATDLRAAAVRSAEQCEWKAMGKGN